MYSFSDVRIEDNPGDGDDSARADYRKEGEYVDGWKLIGGDI